MKKIGFAVIAVSLHLAASSPARASDLVECPGCSTDDMKEYLALSHGSYRAYFDVGAGWVRSFQASGCNYEGTNWRWCVTEVAPWWSEQALLQSMREIEARDPGFFAKNHLVRIPISEVGGGDPVAISIYGPSNGAYGSFMNGVNSFLGNPSRVGPYNQNLAEYLDRVHSRSTTWGFKLDFFHWSTSTSEMPGPTFELDFCTNDGDCARVQVNSDGSARYVESRDADNNVYPSPTQIDAGNFQSPVVGDLFVQHILRAYNGPIHTTGSGTVYAYVTCVYINGVLQSIRIELRRE